MVISVSLHSQATIIVLQEYSKNQVIGLVNLVATMKSWKRKSRLEVIERIEAGV